MLALLLAKRQEVPRERRLLKYGQAATILMQSGVVGMGFLKETWTEAQVLNLPAGEHDFFDRKSGGLLNDMTKFQEKIAKALSAFANSGGGHIIFGQEDDGCITGIPALVKRTPMREWLEQKLPFLVSYPLESFRVHQVIRDSTGSAIPAGKELFVIDVGDSRLAPHQASYPPDRPQYFYRQGGKSIAAPHHFLEALRNRLTFAILDANLAEVHVTEKTPAGEGFVRVLILLRVSVKNVSRVACYKWEVDMALEGEGIGEYLELSNQGDNIPSDTTILPNRRAEKVFRLSFRVNLNEPLEPQVRKKLSKVEIRYYVTSENHIGSEKKIKLEDAPMRSPILEQIGVAIR
jgi:hypothetical protein